MLVGESAPVVVGELVSCEGGNVEVSRVVGVLDEGLLVAVAELEAVFSVVAVLSEDAVADAAPAVSKNSASRDDLKPANPEILGPSVPVIPVKGGADAPVKKGGIDIRRVPQPRKAVVVVSEGMEGTKDVERGMKW